jgi:signal transduction histidine kinase
MEMDIGQMINRWTLRFSKLSPERQAREQPLRALLLRRVLAASFIALIVQASVFIYHGGGLRRFLFWFAWGTIEPLTLLLIAAWFERKHRIALASILVVIALSHIAAFTGVQFGEQHLTGALLALTILVCGLLVGEYYVRTWTVVCCAIAAWCNLSQTAWSWKLTGFWCGFYVATAWLVTLFSRHLERLFEASRTAEEQQRTAIVAERTRFAREIHDSLAQGFTGIVIQLNAAEQRLHPDAEEARPHLHKARDLARQSLEEARRSARALRPGLLSNGNLLGAIEQIGSELTAGSGVRFEAHLEGQPYALSEDAEAHLLRIGQEALTNAVRHAHAGAIEIHLRYQPSAVALEVRDDGCGIGNSPHAGFGLKNMAERAGQLGGKLEIASQPGHGTMVQATIPSS